MSMEGKKINELEGIIQSDLTNDTVVPAVVVQGGTPRETAIKVTLDQLKNWIADAIGNPHIVEIPVQAGATLPATDANLIVMLFRNGNLLRILDDYTTTTNSITFTIPLETDEKITALYSIVAPFVIPVATTTTTGTVKFDGTTIKINSDGQLYTEGGGSSYTAGTGIDITDDTISVKIDNTTIKPNSDGQLYAEVGSSYTAGTAIDLTNDTVSVKIDNSTIKVNSDGQLYTEGGGSIPTLTWYNVETEGNTLTIADTTSSPLVKVYKNGLLLQPTEDYTISGTTLTLTTTLQLTDKITTEVF